LVVYILTAQNFEEKEEEGRAGYRPLHESRDSAWDPIPWVRVTERPRFM
jgi:hypothetical protein